jgi:uncharacterized SAM-binding protein YcdF (DUF218 family)
VSQGFPGFLELLIGPPGGLLLIMLAGLLMLQGHARLGKWLIASGLVLFYLVCMPLMVNLLVAITETPTSITKADFNTPRAQAIVVLGAGRREDAPEYYLSHHWGDTVTDAGLERIRYAVWLAKRSHLPILVSGGLADEDGPAEAIMMKDVIEHEFNQPVKWVETKSRNTYENAKFSAKILLKDKVGSIYLATDALHMKRAVWAFQQQGLKVIPAPTAYNVDVAFSLKNLLPSSKALTTFSYLFHEWVGNIWYRIRY